MSRDENMKVGVPDEAMLEYLHRAKNAFFTIPTAVRDHFLGSTTVTYDPAEICREIKVRYSI